LLVVCFVIAGAVVFVLTKDFVLPIMAMEHTTAGQGWSRLRPMIQANLGSYLGYIGMKILLAMGAAIATGIASLIVILVLAIPVGIVVGVLVAAFRLTWNPVTILLAVVGGGIFLLLLFFLLGLIAAPVAVFFQSYALLFFGLRYRALEMVLYPEPPPAPPPPAAPVMPPPVEPGPAPA